MDIIFIIWLCLAAATFLPAVIDADDYEPLILFLYFNGCTFIIALLSWLLIGGVLSNNLDVHTSTTYSPDKTTTVAMPNGEVFVFEDKTLIHKLTPEETIDWYRNDKPKFNLMKLERNGIGLNTTRWKILYVQENKVESKVEKQ